MGVQATGYEKATHRWPDHVTIYYSLLKSEGQVVSSEELDEALDCLRVEAGEAWLETNSILYHHTLEYQEKMNEFITKSGRAIEALHDCIWDVVMKVMKDAGKSVADGLGIALCLVDMLPIIPLQLAFNMATLGLTGFAPEVYAAWPKSRTDLLDFSHVPPPQSDRNAMMVLQEEIVKNAHGMTEEKAIQPTWLMSVASVSTISVKAAETGDGDGSTCSPCMSHSPVMCTSQSPAQHESCLPTPCASCSLVPHSPSKSPSPAHHSQSSRSSSSSSGSNSGAGSVSGSSSPGSSESGSGDESSTYSPAGSQAPSEGSGSSSSHSTLPEVVLVQGDDEDAASDEEDESHSDDKEAMSQGTVSLLNISNSDNEEARKTTAHEKVWKSYVQFAAW